MVWMVGRELMPDAFHEGPRRAVLVAVLVSFLLMLALQLVLAA